MGCSYSSGQSAVGQADVGAPRSCPVTDRPVEKAWEATLSMSDKECKLASLVEAQRGSNLLPGGVGAHGGTGSCSSASASSMGSLRQSMTHQGTKMSADSQLQYSSPNQTIIIYDWDDTLCPSTSLRRFAHFDAKGRLAAKMDGETLSELNMLAEQVLPLIRFSMTLGKVVIVTNARRPWVEVSCSNFLPALKASLKDIPVIYALELLKDGNIDDFDQGKGSYLTETKARAMKAAVSEFYSRYPRQSWKNIVSIGDAFFEHAAIRQVVGERPTQKRCRTKTIKLLEGPTIAGMVVQLSIVESWLDKIVQMDNDVDIDLSANEDAMDSWVSLFGASP